MLVDINRSFPSIAAPAVSRARFLSGAECGADSPKFLGGLGSGGRYPDLIIDLLSDSTAHVDPADKKSLYQNIFHTPEYFCFSPITGEFAGFRLIDQQYEAIPANEQGWRWSAQLGLYLGEG